MKKNCGRFLTVSKTKNEQDRGTVKDTDPLPGGPGRLDILPGCRYSTEGAVRFHARELPPRDADRSGLTAESRAREQILFVCVKRA